MALAVVGMHGRMNFGGDADTLEQYAMIAAKSNEAAGRGTDN
jgi:hypothetical protein